MIASELTDREIVELLLGRDRAVTHAYFYERCYPLFSSVYNRFYTDCGSVDELIGEIYLYVMTPRRDTGRSKLEDFGFRCTLTQWLKVVTLHYCHHLFARRIEKDENFFYDDDRNGAVADSLESQFRNLDMNDILTLLGSMPNSRYSSLIRLRYLEERSNEETAALLGLTMSNYYNIHLRARRQFCDALRREGLI